jgi:hypothetical protein
MSRKPISSRLTTLLVALLALALAPALSGYGQGYEPLTRDGPRVLQASVPRAPALAEPASAAPAANRVVHLPLVIAPPKVTIQFASSVDANGNLINPSTTFAYGITHLYYEVTIFGAKGLSYREEWSINGARQTQLDYGPVTIPYEAIKYKGGVYYASGRTLDRGTYQINIFVNGGLYQTGVAKIQ